MSSALNVVGMAVAFGAFYVIMTQVSWDFGYNQRLKDADRTFVIALPSNYSPVSLLIVRLYFRGFAYHVPLYWWVFAVALLAVLVITVIIVTLRSLSAATSNPVDHLKAE